MDLEDQLSGLVGGKPTVDPPAKFDISDGQVLRRREVHLRFGGSRQSGIASAPRIKSVFLFSSTSGHEFGYNYDGPQEDGSFLYTGEGQHGDQKLTRGNAAMLRPDVTLRLFQEERPTYVRYVGEFRLDDHEPYFRREAPDAAGDTRQVLVFRLWPTRGSTTSTAEPTGPQVDIVPLEKNETEFFQRNEITKPTTAQRVEAALVMRYRDWLEKSGGTPARHKIKLPGRSRPLYSDVFVRETAELIEAKAKADRDHVRNALGQVLDYERFASHRMLGALLPKRPETDLIELLTKHGVNCIYETSEGKFERVDAY